MTQQRATARRSRRAAATLAAAALTLALLPDHRPAEAANPPVDQVDLANGAEAVAAIGTDLGRVARRHGMTGTELREMLLEDDTLHVDPADNLVFIDEAPPADPSGYAGTVPSTGMPANEVFTLASRPASTRTIYLDFTGHTTAGTSWNSAYGIASFTTPAFTLDGATNSYNQAELDLIVQVWSMVADSYAPFDVNVTTADPGVAALVKSGNADTVHGTRVVIGPNSWAPFQAGGVAYLGSINWPVDTPAFVFSENVANSGRYIADAAIHEVGHTFGLHHDGTATEGYYRGHANWAPIMGVGYSKGIVHWSKGEYPLANNTEDDLSIISWSAPFVADTEGSLLTPLDLGTVPVTRSGVVSTPTDVDVIAFTAPGPVTLDFKLRTVYSSLDAAITVIDDNGVPVWNADPGGVADVHAQIPLTPGSYTVQIDGVGSGDAATTGYSDYGSLGGYALSIAPLQPYVSLSPVRLLETRSGTPSTVDGQFWKIGSRAAGTTSTVTVGGRGGIPSSSTVLMNLTVMSPSTAGHVTVYPCGTTRPNASNVNFVAGQTVSNTVVTSTGTGGAVCVYTAATTHVALDVHGYFPKADALIGLTPARLLETRPTAATTVDGQFWKQGLRPAAATTALTVAGRGGVPSGAPAVALNLTVTGPTSAGHVTVYPCDQPRPTASNINYLAGQTKATTVLVRTAADGTVCFHNASATHLVVDVSGYFPTSDTLAAISPARLLETRPTSATTIDGQFWKLGTRPAGSTTTVAVTGRAAVPTSTSGVLMNLTVIAPASAGWATVYPCDRPRPTVPNLTFAAGQTTSNVAVARTSAAGTVCLYTTVASHFVIDTGGWFVDGT